MKFLLVIIAAAFTMTTGLGAADNGFLIEIEFDRETCRFTFQQGEEVSVTEFELDEAEVVSGAVRVRGQNLIDGEGFHFGDAVVPIEEIAVGRVSTRRDNYRVTLEQKRQRSERTRLRKADWIYSFERVVVPEEEFVRGDLLLVGDDLRVEGEVNGDVIVLFGGIRLTRTAICQRNVLAIGGTIDKHRDARVYGTYQATDKWQKWDIRRKRRRVRDQHEVDFGGTMAYNRVDGLAFDASLTFRSEEKAVPDFFAHYGYGFWSNRSKYRLGFEQVLFNYHHLSFGGEVYRLTKTEDEWRCRTDENNIYAVIAREDFRDYFEGEGGSFFLQQEIGYDHRFRIDYFFDELAFMQANPDQWSLFGGSKKFRSNFSSVSEPFLAEHLPDYDLDEAVLSFTYEFNTAEDRYDELLRSGWVARLAAEHSDAGVGSDFDYDRVTIEIRRYQPLTYRQNLNLRLIAGSATGRMPLHRHFFLGGIRTLRAYKIKEFYGTRMAMANIEYVIDFPSSDIGIALLFDIGKTGWDSDFLTESSWIGDVGVGINLGGLRLELTRQLNGYSDDLQFSLLMGRSF